MAITRATPDQKSGTYTGGITSPWSLTHTLPNNATSGNLLVVPVGLYNPGGVTLTAGMLTKDSGTATIGTPTLDKVISDAPYNAAIYSVPVTGTGSLVLKFTLTGASGSIGIGISVQEYVGADVSGTRVEDTAEGSNTTGAPTTATADSADGAVFVGLAVTDLTATHTPGADYTEIFEDETDDSITGGSEDRIVSGATTDAADWSAPTTTAWRAVLVVYKVAAVVSDLKISQFTALTSPVAADLLCIVDSTTSPASKKLTIDNLLDLFISDVTMTVLTATSGATYAPPAEAKKLLIGVVGGGGGGNGGNNTDSAGGGGGGGGTCLKLVSSTAVTNGTYVVGPGGGVSVTGTASSGKDTTFNIDSTNIMTGGGGGGGTQGAGFTVVGIQAAGGAGGTATGGDLNMPGKRGERGVIFSAATGWAGSGGDSVFGFGAGNPGVNTTGSPGGAYGGGGCGGHASAATNKEGSAGAKGTIFVLEFFG